ncbi:PrsW family intramembrane metalloprotease [Corynebacterium cystitidis]|uniref:PrsW family intramembrane metalloprotease n=1 Tax=Corynebacterium cystitidis TaxID=35757 RepID=UPI00211E4BCA|nr:PrsW family intramembrane metalloprotease [Corynebacterium cystitidis]
MSNRIFPITLVVACVIGGLGLVLTAFSLFLTSPAGASIGIVGAVVQVIVAIVILRLPALGVWPEGGNWRWVAAALVWGGGIGVMWAVGQSSMTQVALPNLPFGAFEDSWLGAYPEEPIKALGVVLILMSFGFLNRPIHGLVVGTFSGLGFEVVENMGYGAAMAPFDPSADINGAFLTWLVRVAMGPFLHALWTGIAGYAIGWALFALGRRLRWRIGVVILGLLVPFFLHFTYNWHAGGEVFPIVKSIGLAVISYVIYALLIWHWQQKADPSPESEYSGSHLPVG